MSFVVFIFICVVLIIRYAGDKTQQSIAREDTEKKIEIANETIARFKRRYTDQMYESDCQDAIKLGDPKAVAMRDRVFYETGVKISGLAYLMAVMSERCKIPYSIATMRIGTPIRTDRYTYKEFIKKCDDQLLFLKWYDKEMIKNGMKEKLLYAEPLDIAKPGAYFGNYPTKSVQIIDSARGGVFMWESQKYEIYSGKTIM